MTREQPERWHVDKGVPLALILSILTTFGSGIWYAAASSARIDRIEEKIAEQRSFRDDITVLKEQVRNLTRLLERVETVLERRAQQMQKSDKFGAIE